MIDVSQSMPPHERKTTMSKPTHRELHSIEDLNFESFLYSDMNKFDARVAGSVKKVFAKKEYVIEITISGLQPLKIPKTAEEFKSFHKALKLRFPNIDWPDYATSGGIFKKKVQMKHVLNDILVHVVEAAKITTAYKKSLLGIFYAFFLDTDIVKKYKQDAKEEANRANSMMMSSMVTTTTTTTVYSEDEDEEDNSQFANIVEDNIKEFEKRYSHILTPESLPSSGLEKPSAINTSEVISIKVPPSYERVEKIPAFEKPTMTMIAEPVKSEENEQPASLCETTLTNNLPSEMNFSHCGPQNLETETSPKSVGGDEEHEKLFESHHRNRLGHIQNKKHSSAQSSHIEELEDFVQAEKASKAEKLEEKAAKKKNNVFAKLFKKKEPKAKEAEDNTVRALSINEQPSGQIEYLNIEGNEEEKGGPRKKELMVRQRLKSVAKDTKEIPNFAGNIYSRLSSENKWNPYYARIMGGCVALFKTVLDNAPMHYIPCFNCNLNIVDDKIHGNYIELYHNYDSERMQITVEQQAGKAPIDDDPSKNLRTWYEQIKIASDKIKGLKLIHFKYNPIGKFQVVLYGASNVKGLPSNSFCYIRLVHSPFTLFSSKCVRDNMRWKQSIFLPIYDPFFPIYVELICSYNDGWLTDVKKEEVICSGEIIIADVMSNRETGFLTVELPMQYTEAKKKALSKHPHFDQEPPILEVRLKNLSSRTSYFAPPCKDYVEGIKIDGESWNKQLLKLSISRIKRVIAFIQLKAKDLKDIFNFKYPIFSYICMVVFTLTACFASIGQLIPNLLILLILISLYYHPNVYDRVNDFFGKLFFDENMLNPLYLRPRVQTVVDLEIKQNLNTEKWKYKLVDPDSLVTTIKKAKVGIVEATFILTQVAGMLEKFKNIVTWEDPSRTTIFILFTLAGYMGLSIVGLRIAIIGGIIGRFIEGRKFYKNLYKKNRQHAEHALKLVVRARFPEVYVPVFSNIGGPWPPMKDFARFQQKVVKHMGRRLSINLPEDALLIAKTPKDFLTVISTCHTPLKCKATPEEEAYLNIMKKKALKFKPKNLIYFIMNIPSDYYRILHPKTESKAK